MFMYNCMGIRIYTTGEAAGSGAGRGGRSGREVRPACGCVPGEGQLTGREGAGRKGGDYEYITFTEPTSKVAPISRTVVRTADSDLVPTPIITTLPLPTPTIL